jgi:hypothetical protein
MHLPVLVNFSTRHATVVFSSSLPVHILPPLDAMALYLLRSVLMKVVFTCFRVS